MIKILFKICREYWLALIVFLIVGISQTFVGLYSIVFFQRLLDSITEARQFADLTNVLFWFIGLTAINHLLIYLEGYPGQILNNGAFMWMKLQAMQKIARINFLSYQDLGTGNLIQLIENGATATKNILNNFYLQIVRGIIPQLIITFAFIRFYDQSLFALILGLYGGLFVLSYYLMIFLRREMDRMLTSQEDFSKFSVRGFMELVVFRVNGQFKKEFKRVQQISDEIVRSRAKIYLVQELFFTGFAALVFILEVVVIIQQANKIIAGVSTVGTLVALTRFIQTVTSPISSFSVAYVNYKLDLTAFNRFTSFLSLPDDIGLNQGRDFWIDEGVIEFRDVNFSFGDKSVFQGLSLTFAGGRTTALVGSSGSGKSTLVRLLLHLLKPNHGQVLVDGQDLSQVNLESFYREVAYIPQEPPIFDGTIRENLTFDARIEADRMKEVICQVDLDDFINSLPNGLETVVGERGLKLSGGERQRLAFGRILINDPKIVVLDEPTSALDSLTEHFVTQNMTTFLKGKTVVVIAHRLQTVKNADKIVVLENGEIIQEGYFDDLIAVAGKFRHLWEAQTRQVTLSG